MLTPLPDASSHALPDVSKDVSPAHGLAPAHDSSSDERRLSHENPGETETSHFATSLETEETRALEAPAPQASAPKGFSMETQALRSEMARGEILSEETTSKVFVSRKRASFPPALAASVPALLMLGLGWAARYGSFPLALSDEKVGEGQNVSVDLWRDAVFSQSQTAIVQPEIASTVLWHARLQESRGITGRAPIDGQITRVWVQNGQRVETGDRILRIASSVPALAPNDAPSSRRRRAAEAQAEDAQVEASRAQNNLQVKMDRAQSQLAAAQQRVARAKMRIAQTTEIVGQLKKQMASGENLDDAPVETVKDAPEAVSTDNAQHAATQARAAAMQEARNAARQATEAENRATSANRVLDEAQSAARAATQKARKLREARERETAAASQESSAANDEPLARSEPGDAKPKNTPRAPKITTSQNSIDEAETQAREAAKTLTQVREKARSAEAESAKKRASANAAQESATRLLRQLQVFGDDSDARGKAERPSERQQSRRETSRSQTRPTALPSVSGAVRMVRDATQESADAQREAHRLKSQVDDYARQAKQTGQQLSSSSGELSSAQQSSLDQTLQANLSVVRAPSSGVVSWVASVSDSVRSGNAIVRVGKNGVLQARFVDYSGLWRRLQTASALPAFVSQNAQRPAFLNTSSTRLTEKTSDSQMAMARIESVTPPDKAGEPAIVRASIVPVSNASKDEKTKVGNSAQKTTTRQTLLRAGMTVWCSLENRGQRAIMRVPQSAIFRPNAPKLNASDVASAARSSISSTRYEQNPNISATNTNAANASNTNVNAAQSDIANANDANANVDVANSANVANRNRADSETASAKVASAEAASAKAADAAVNMANIAQSGANDISLSGARRDDAAGNSARNDAVLVAVLKPSDAKMTSDENSPDAGIADPGVESGEDWHRIEWRRVELGLSKDGTQQILSGLSPGERVALRPSELWDFSQRRGAQARIHLVGAP